MFPETKSRETLRFEGNKIHCFPRDQSLSVYYVDQEKRGEAGVDLGEGAGGMHPPPSLR